MSKSIYPVVKEYTDPLTHKKHIHKVNVEDVFEHDTHVRIPHQCILVGSIDDVVVLQTTPLSDNYKVKHNNTQFIFKKLKER